MVKIYLYGSPEAADFAHRMLKLHNAVSNIYVTARWMHRAASAKPMDGTSDRLSSAKIANDNLLERGVQD